MYTQQWPHNTALASPTLLLFSPAFLPAFALANTLPYVSVTSVEATDSRFYPRIMYSSQTRCNVPASQTSDNTIVAHHPYYANPTQSYSNAQLNAPRYTVGSYPSPRG